MLNLATKLFLALTSAALIAAVGYGLAIGDRAGADLLAVLAGGFAIVTAVTALALAPDRPPLVAEDAGPPERRPAYSESDVPADSPWPLVAALAMAALALATAAGANWLAAALIATLVPAAGWLAQVWREHPSFSRRARERVVERLLAPLAMPVLATVGALFIAVMISRVLLAVSTTASWVLALLLAAGLLVALWIIATRPRLQSSALIGLAVVAVASMTAAGAIGARAGEREFHPHEPEHPTEAVVARNVQFEPTRLEFPADTEVVIKFENRDTELHNVAFYTSSEPDRRPIWAGQPILEDEIEYKTRTPAAGTYAFVCDFHPAMVGELVVTEGHSDAEHDVGEH